jgi:hypothetical protein
VSPTPSAKELLAGPRARRLCWELSRAPLPGGALDGRRVFECLQRSVDFAMYWQPPDKDDALLRARDSAVALAPVADRLLESAAIAWWATPLDPERQRWIEFARPDGASDPRIPGVPDRLLAWRAAEERRNVEFGDLRRDYPDRYEITSGHWWSTPDRWDALITSRDLAPYGPVGLWLLEDFPGWESAASWPAVPAEGTRVLELTGPDALADLVRRHPFDVSESRQPDWKRATGRTGRWLIPDWPSVADEFDAVHVTVFGYLTCAGRPIAVDDDAATLMAGWAPDETYWLTEDAVQLGEPASRWRRVESDWVRTG